METNDSHGKSSKHIQGKVVLVTGATDGIGKQVARELAERGASVILHGKSAERVDGTLSELRRRVRDATFYTAVADFTSLEQVHAMAEDILQRFPRLDILINNAGVYMKQRVLTKNGYETMFQVNYLAHFYLTISLLELLKKSAPARIIHVSSIAHSSGRIEFDNLQGEQYFDAYHAYALSKLALLLFNKELSIRLKNTHVTSNALHPGVINTKLLHTGFNIQGAPLSLGVQTILYLATSPDVEKVSGKYFVRCKQTYPSAIVENRELRTKFWEYSEALVHSTLVHH
ncbi:MAG: SDR family oxidoreductase [Bacteroidetes bacterium]|nr:SDR family oxidoreductase [Bacteroidota bacterium]